MSCGKGHLFFNGSLEFYIFVILHLTELPPTTPQNLAVVMENNTVTLRWESASSTTTTTTISNPVTYSIDVSINDGKHWLPFSIGLKEPEYQCDTLSYGTSYLFRVKALNSFGSSEATNPVKFVRGNCDKLIIFKR